MNSNGYDYGREGSLPPDQTQRIIPSPYDPNQPLGYEQPKQQQYATPVKPYPGSTPQELPPTPPAPIQPYQSHLPQYPPPPYDAPDMDALRRDAMKTVKAKEGFRAHLTSYIFVLALNVAIWAILGITTGRFVYFWPIWIAFGWGIGLFAHYISLYGGWKPSTEAERQRAVDEEIRRRMGRLNYPKRKRRWMRTTLHPTRKLLQFGRSSGIYIACP